MPVTRYLPGHALTALDSSDETCVAVCECTWVTLTIGEQRRSEAAYAHAAHAHGVRLDAWAAKDFRGPEPVAPERGAFLARKRFKRVRCA